MQSFYLFVGLFVIVCKITKKNVDGWEKKFQSKFMSDNFRIG